MAENKILNNLLQEIAEVEQIQQPNIEVKAVSTSGANYTSNLFRIKISDKSSEKSLKLFAKDASMSESFRNSFNNFQVYDTERIAYTDLFKVYRQLEENFGVSEEDKLLLPKYYGANTAHLQETIVFEDLSSRGFELYSRFESVDWPYAAAAFTELAKFHALSFTFRHEKPAEYENMLKYFPDIQFCDNEKSGQESAKLAIQSVHEKNKCKLQKFLDGVSWRSFNDLAKILKHEVLVHGDFRPCNMLYRNLKNDAKEVILVDYQTIRVGCPVFDFVYFIACGTDGPFRAKYYKRLVEHYYSELGCALARFGLNVKNIYPREDFEFELKEELPFGLKLAVLMLPIQMTPEEVAVKPEEFSFDTGVFGKPGHLYKTKLNEMVDDYVAWGVLVD